MAVVRGLRFMLSSLGCREGMAEPSQYKNPGGAANRGGSSLRRPPEPHARSGMSLTVAVQTFDNIVALLIDSKSSNRTNGAGIADPIAAVQQGACGFETRPPHSAA
jgi:hypothetical protein